MTADYLIRDKNRLDAENPLFKERSREAEMVVRAVSQIVNSTATAASRQKSRNLEAAKLKKKNQPPARSSQRRVKRRRRSDAAIRVLIGKLHEAWRLLPCLALPAARQPDLIVERKLNIVLPFCYPTR